MSIISELKTNEPLAHEGNARLATELREFTRSELPEAMVPSQFVILDSLPKLPNGKVDRKSLPKPDSHGAIAREYIAPRFLEEEKIAAVWSDILSLSRVSVEDSFFDLGGDSLSAVQMVAQVRKMFDVAISLRKVFKAPTISALAALVKGKGQTTVVGGLQNLNDDELRLEAVLPDDIGAQPGAIPAKTNNYNHILLTGGTGYTGAFILRELLDRSEAKLWVVVRAGDAERALTRVLDNLRVYGLLQEHDSDRIIGVPGDVGLPYLGIDKSIYAVICTDVEMIIHNAAISNYALPYRQLKPANVLGTLEVLRLAGRSRIKPLHYVSSLAVFPGHVGEHVFVEKVLEEPDGLAGGYRQTKWVSDRLVALAGDKGIPYCIYRPGHITGAQYSGACSTDTYLNAAIKGCIQLNAELEFDVTLEVSQVDFCAKAITHIALTGDYQNEVFHLTQTNPVYWRDILVMLREYGYSFDVMNYVDWYKRLTDTLEAGKENALGKFFPLFGENAPSKDAGDEGSFPLYQHDNLDRALHGSSIASMPLDQNLMNRYLDYFVEIDFIDSPSVAAEKRGVES